jgi:hypothetical protein
MTCLWPTVGFAQQLIVPSAGWTGTAGSGYGGIYDAVPTDPVRTGKKPCMQWFSVPNGVYTSQVTIGVGALHSTGIAKVRFYCEGTHVDVTARQILEGCPNIHAVTVNVPSIATTGQVSLYAVAYPVDNTLQTRCIGPFNIWVDSGSTLAGSTTDPDYYVDGTGGLDTNSGTSGSPFQTLAAGINKHKTNGSLGGTIQIKTAGTYTIAANGTLYNSATRWITIKPISSIVAPVGSAVVTLAGPGMNNATVPQVNAPGASTIRPKIGNIRYENCKIDWTTFDEFYMENGQSWSFYNIEMFDASQTQLYGKQQKKFGPWRIPTGPTFNNATIMVDTVSGSGIATAHVVAGGDNYAVNDVLTLTGGGSGGNGTVTVATTSYSGLIGGAAATINVTAAGTGYTAGQTYTTTGGGGNAINYYIDNCYFHDMTAGMNGAILVKNLTMYRVGVDFYDNCFARFHNTTGACNIDALRSYNSAFTVQYTGGSATATIAHTNSGGAAACNNGDTASLIKTNDSVNGTQTFTCTASDTVGNLVTAINALPGWTATLNNDFLLSAYLTKTGTPSWTGWVAEDCKTQANTYYTGIDIHNDYVQDYGWRGISYVTNVVDLANQYIHQHGTAGVDYSTTIVNQGHFLSDGKFYDYGVVLSDVRNPVGNGQHICQLSAAMDHLFFDSCDFLPNGQLIEFRTDANGVKNFAPTNCSINNCSLPNLLNGLNQNTGLTGLTINNCNVYSSNSKNAQPITIQTNSTSGTIASPSDPEIDATTFIPTNASNLLGRLASPYEYTFDRNALPLTGSNAAIGAYQQSGSVTITRKRFFNQL